jgi:hypothetical protein
VNGFFFFLQLLEPLGSHLGSPNSQDLVLNQHNKKTKKENQKNKAMVKIQKKELDWRL